MANKSKHEIKDRKKGNKEGEEGWDQGEEEINTPDQEEGEEIDQQTSSYLIAAELNRSSKERKKWWPS